MGGNILTARYKNRLQRNRERERDGNKKKGPNI